MAARTPLVITVRRAMIDQYPSLAVYTLINVVTKPAMVLRKVGLMKTLASDAQTRDCPHSHEKPVREPDVVISPFKEEKEHKACPGP